MAQFKKESINLRPGLYIAGISGNKLYTGAVMEHPKQPGKPWVFRSRFSENAGKPPGLLDSMWSFVPSTGVKCWSME